MSIDLEDLAVELGLTFDSAIRAHGLSHPRTLQSAAGKIGASDLGFCRQKVVLMSRGVEQSDAKAIWPAQVGTAVHAYVEAAIAKFFPDWTIDSVKVRATFECGAEVSGTPDFMGLYEFGDQTVFLVLDGKTADGYSHYQAKGVTQNHRFQRRTYGLGAAQAGLNVVDGVEVPIVVGNVFLDRSGKTETCWVDVEVLEAWTIAEVNEWLLDVIYAMQHSEDASRDVAAPVCERICEYYTACRGDLPMEEAQPLDAETVRWIEAYDEGRAMEKQGKAIKDDAANVIRGLNGFGGGFQIRTTKVGDSGSERIDVRRMR